MTALLVPDWRRALRLAITAVAFGATSACSGAVPATTVPTGPACVVEVVLVDGGPGMRIIGSGYPPDQPATLGLDDGRNATVRTQAEYPALHADIRGVVRFEIGAERENVGTNRIELSAGGCTARDSVEITDAMFPPTCPSADPVASGGPKADAYEALVVADEPIGYWQLEEVEGPFAAARVGGQGAFQGNPRFGQAGPIVGSRALALDGDGDWVNFSELRLTADFTVEGWLYFCEHSIDNTDVLVGQAGPGPDINFGLGAPRLWDGNQDPAFSDHQLDMARWYHIAVVRSETVVRLYVDGTEVGSGAYADPFPIRALGAGNDGSLAGMLDEVAIYDHALSVEQLAAHVAAAS